MRRPHAVLCALVAVLTSLLAGGSVVLADQTVVFDAAGNAPHISLIGDSTLTGVRWYADYGALERFNFVFSAESCRRTVERSCISREGYRSANVISTMQTLDGRLGDVLVVMSGYNDPIWTIDEAIAGVVSEAQRQGVRHVVWLSLRAGADVDYSDPQEQTSINTFREYNEQLVAAAATSEGYLQVADWATYSLGASAWFEADGVHLTRRGVDAITTFIAGIAERVLAGEDVSPDAAPWTVLVPGAHGATVMAVQTALVDADIDVPGGADGIYGNDTMAAVAEYQRRHPTLQVTGAVDAATARMLGVYDDADDDAERVATTLERASEPDEPAVGRGDAVAPVTEAAASIGRDRGRAVPLSIAAAISALAALTIAARRRVVSSRRSARRWARVHPATSPHRTVADMRRAGQLPSSAAHRAQIYDRMADEAVEAGAVEHMSADVDSP